MRNNIMDIFINSKILVKCTIRKTHYIIYYDMIDDIIVEDMIDKLNKGFEYSYKDILLNNSNFNIQKILKNNNNYDYIITQINHNKFIPYIPLSELYLLDNSIIKDIDPDDIITTINKEIELLKMENNKFNMVVSENVYETHKNTNSKRDDTYILSEI